MKRKICLILCLVLVLSAVLSGCGKKEEPAPVTGGEDETEETVVNPAKTRDGASDTLIIGTITGLAIVISGFCSRNCRGSI